MSGNIKPRYAVLSYNFNHYEIVHEIENPQEDVEYIMVSDDKTLTSSTWTIKYRESTGDPFYDCFYVRYHPFEFVSTDIVIKIDGSMVVKDSLDPIIEEFESEGADICLGLHPTRSEMRPEYSAWVSQRGYDVYQAIKCFDFLQNGLNYPIEGYHGLYQYNFMIQRNDRKNNLLNDMTFSFLRYLAPEGKEIDRLDQTIGSAVINKFFKDMKVLPVSGNLFDSRFFAWCVHGTNHPMTSKCPTQGWLFNKRITTYEPK